jgi:sugar/nucleoside kinase (ribokinase family)
MGEDGSVVQETTGERWRVPAVPTDVVDVTGAGNAYCGGYLVALGEGLDAVEAGLRATVSASFAVEQFGVPQFDEGTVSRARGRLAWARQRVESLL